MLEIKKIELQPGLYIVSTPIGNLADVTLRALSVLNSVDFIFCENTRNSVKLLSHYDIKTKLSSYNDHSNQQDRNKIIRLVKEGKSIALISDAGTPLISDPGYKLIKELHQEGLYVTSCPGPCSAVNALALSGLPTDKFIFEGFLPLKEKDRKIIFKNMRLANASTILFDTSKKIEDTLKDLLDFFGDIEIVITREMTKKFEERISEKISNIMPSELKGEIVIIIPPQVTQESLDDIKHDIKTLKSDSSNSSRDIVKILTFKYPDTAKKVIYDLVIDT